MLKKENRISFEDGFYSSANLQTIMGETYFKDILFLDYRDSEAGSNPREYTGLKKANNEIIRSLLKDPIQMFRFLHSGMIVSLTGLRITGNVIEFESCCLTNGNQTRFIILILVLLKLYAEKNDLTQLTPTLFNQFVKDEFKDDVEVSEFLKFVKPSKAKEIAKFLISNRKYLDNFNAISLNKFLHCKIRIQINVIENVIEGVDDLDEYSAGTLIAKANNETQNVKEDDIFGSTYKMDLEQSIFSDFIGNYGNEVKIEYRMGEIVTREPKVHILTLLRPIISTGILTRENEIFAYSNQRAPVYTLFQKLLRTKNGKAQSTIKAISKLVPFLYQIREDHVVNRLKVLRSAKDRELKAKALSNELSHTTLSGKLKIVSGEPTEDSLKALRKVTSYNIEHILPVFIYRIRSIIDYDEQHQKIFLNVETGKDETLFQSLLEAIYTNYVEIKLKGVTGSITDEIRSKDFFGSGEEAFIVLKNLLKFNQSDYIEKNRYIISK